MYISSRYVCHWNKVDYKMDREKWIAKFSSIIDEVSRGSFYKMRIFYVMWLILCARLIKYSFMVVDFYDVDSMAFT